MTIQELQQKYDELCHAMQTGVATTMNFDPSDTSPKHLRVGINSAMNETSVLAQLLIKNQVISEQEYWELMVEMMQREVNLYKKRIADTMGAEVNLL